MDQFGARFTGTKEGHVATDIAACAAMAGRLLLEDGEIDFAGHEPGSTLLWESHASEEALFRFMKAADATLRRL